MTTLYTVADKNLLEARYTLSPSGRVRFCVSRPIGSMPGKTKGQENTVDPILCNKRQASIYLGNSPLLDNRSEIQQAKKKGKNGWGQGATNRALTRKQASNIRETVAAMDRAYQEGVCSRPLLLTFTLPSVDVNAFKALADYSSYAVNRLNTIFGRYFKEHARCGVWEWQKRGALHYHCVIATIGTKCDPKKAKEFLRARWAGILEDIGARSGADMFLSSKGFSHRDSLQNIQVDCQEIEKSASAYLSKYLSKGEGVKNKEGRIGTEAYRAKKENRFFCPPRWSNRNRTATDWRKKYTFSGVIGCFNPARTPDVLGILHDCACVLSAAGTAPLMVEKFGYSMYCLYAIVSDFFDCVDAMKEFIKEIKNRYCYERKLWSGMRKYAMAYSYQVA